jgi:hypothetical protein
VLYSGTNLKSGRQADAQFLAGRQQPEEQLVLREVGNGRE